MKGFKDKTGIFHPITPYKGIRKSRDKTVKIQGVRLERSGENTTPVKAVLLERRRLKFSSKEEFAPLSNVRTEGNQTIQKVINAMKESHPDKTDFVIHNTPIYNDYDEIQKTFFYSKDNVEKLLEWRKDPNPDTWKWKIPLSIENPRNRNDIFVEDNHNKGFVGEAYRGQATITLMSPRQYIGLVCPKCLQDFMKKGFEGLDFDKGLGKDFQSIKELSELFKNGTPIDTPYIETRGTDVVLHEGRHRAFGAMMAGIKKIPVYIYSRDPMTDDQRITITQDPTNVLKPDSKY